MQHDYKSIYFKQLLSMYFNSLIKNFMWSQIIQLYTTIQRIVTFDLQNNEIKSYLCALFSIWRFMLSFCKSYCVRCKHIILETHFTLYTAVTNVNQNAYIVEVMKRVNSRKAYFLAKVFFSFQL